MKRDYLLLSFGIVLFAASVLFLFYSFSSPGEKNIIETEDMIIPGSEEKFSGEVHQIIIKEGRFIPDYLEITSGDQVEWINKDVQEHSITFEDALLDENLLVEGTVNQIFITEGEWRYFSRSVPGITGTIRIG